jgi:hypothetical protein
VQQGNNHPPIGDGASIARIGKQDRHGRAVNVDILSTTNQIGRGFQDVKTEWLKRAPSQEAIDIVRPH